MVDLERMEDPQESSFGNMGGHVSVLSQNMNGAKVTLDRARDLGSRLRGCPVDIYIMCDVRTKKEDVSAVKYCLREGIGPDYMVYVFPAKAIQGAPNLPSSYVGGFIVLVRCSSKSGWTTNTFHKDKSGFGMYIGIDLFHTSGRRVRVIGTFLPCHSPRSVGKKSKRGDEPSHRSQALQEEEAEQHQNHINEVVPLNSSMEEKIMFYVRTLPNADKFGCARDWYWHQVNPLLAQASWEHIVLGDFNNRWPTSAPTSFQQECALQGLQNHLATAMTERGINIKTFYRNFLPWSDLDHILTTLPSEAQVGGGILNHASW
jgi:hypothetical protein